jgi:DNA-binding NtrC family response regulator
MKKSILVVDDDSSVRESLQNILTGAGYEVTAATDGESAEIEFGKADLLILDLNLPIQDGWDVLGNVNSEYPLLPVIVITGLADQLDEQTIPGASAFLEKPIEVPQLLQTIERLLSQTPDERMAEASRSSELWQLPLNRAAHPERRPKPGIRRFRTP